MNEQTLIGHVRCPLCTARVTIALPVQSEISGFDADGNAVITIVMDELAIVDGCDHVRESIGKMSFS